MPAVQRARRRLRRRRARRRGPCATATSGSSTARRSGPRSPTSRSGGCSSAAPNPDVPEAHAASSYFVVDMQQPGVEVRPLVQITGDAEFNEVFFNDARVATTGCSVREGDGWKVAITTLMNERVSLSGAGSIGGDAVGGSPIAASARPPPGHRRPADAPAARAGVHREPADPDQQPARGRQAQERRRGRARGLDHQAACRPSSTSASRSLALDLEGVGRRRVGGRADLEREQRRSRHVRSADGDDRRRRARASCGRRPTRSRAGRPTSCATSSASGCSASPRSPTLARAPVEGRAAARRVSRLRGAGRRAASPVMTAAGSSGAGPEPQAALAQAGRSDGRDRPRRARRLADAPRARQRSACRARRSTTCDEVATASASIPRLARRLWRRSGSPTSPPDAPVFTDDDVEAF